MSVSTFKVSHDVEAIHIPQLMDLFASAWWATQRTETEARGVLAGSDIVVTVVHRPTGRLVGLPVC
jgi:hypothetical protein